MEAEDVNQAGAVTEVTAENIPAVDPFTALVGVPDAVLLTCSVASKNLNLVGVPGTVVTVDAGIEVQFPGIKITTARNNLKII